MYSKESKKGLRKVHLYETATHLHLGMCAARTTCGMAQQPQIAAEVSDLIDKMHPIQQKRAVKNYQSPHVAQ